MKDTVLIFTSSEELAVRGVTYHLQEMGQCFIRVNTDRLFGKGVCLRHIDGQLSGSLVFGKRVDLGRVKSVWYRRPPMPMLPVMVAEHQGFISGEYRSFLWSLYTSIEAFWMNPPLAIHLLEHNKLRQMIDAVEIGLRVPDTIITNSFSELIRFCHHYGNKIALKVLRSSSLADGEADSSKLIYTNLINLKQIIERRKEIRLAPVLVQEYIEKELEFRVTIVGDQIFACAIYSQDSEMTKHDWRRYDIENVRHEPYDLPVEVKEKLLTLMTKWGLSYGAIDMILTPEREYVFLEVNPTGQWGWIEALTGMPISRAIADLLANPPSQ